MAVVSALRAESGRVRVARRGDLGGQRVAGSGEVVGDFVGGGQAGQLPGAGDETPVVGSLSSSRVLTVAGSTVVCMGEAPSRPGPRGVRPLTGTTLCGVAYGGKLY